MDHRISTRRRVRVAGAVGLIVITNLAVIAATATRAIPTTMAAQMTFFGCATVAVGLSARRVVVLFRRPDGAVARVNHDDSTLSPEQVVLRLERRVAQRRRERSIADAVRRRLVTIGSAPGDDAIFTRLRQPTNRESLVDIEWSLRAASADNSRSRVGQDHGSRSDARN